MNGPTVLSNNSQDSSIALRELSLELQELHIDKLQITPDLFWPSDISLMGDLRLFWSNMEVVHLSIVPFVHPSGTL